MKTILHKANTRGYFDHGWLKTHHTFSFADYYDSSRIHFGMLRVLNDDLVDPGEGFGKHPHKNMEIITIPLKGELRHGDSMENLEVIHKGMIQLMSAGSGVYHSEFNASHLEPVEFLQIWVLPKSDNGLPKYASYQISGLIKKNEISTFIAPGTPIEIGQDAWFSWADFDTDKKIVYNLHSADSGVYIFVVGGEVGVAGQQLLDRDGIGIWETPQVDMEIASGSEVLIMEVPMR